MRVAFRADASLAIGTGHAMRCLTLAEELRRRGAEVLFICRRHAGHLCGLISEKGFRVECLPGQNVALDETPAGPASRAHRGEGENLPAHTDWLGADWRLDAEQTAEAIRGLGVVDWLIVDHYALDARWESALRAVTRRIMVIDDLADRAHDCDLLLDQNLYPEMERRYEALVPTGCCTLLGPRYALLRPEFAEARAKLRERTGDVRRVLISFGGVDATNETQKAIEAVGDLPGSGVEVDVVIGGGNPHRNNLAAICARQPGVHLHLQTHRMAQLMVEADLSIGGGGTVAWERCAVGLPAISWPIAENQALQIDALAAAGAIVVPDARRDVRVDILRAHVACLLHSARLRQAISRAAMRLCDGLGASRGANVICTPEVTLRPACVTDGDSMYRWRNEPNVREVSLTEEPIPRETHRAWFLKALSSKNRVLLIAEHGTRAVGVLRYDLKGNEADISIFLAPGQTGRGFGLAVLTEGEKWLRREHPEVSNLRAAVRERNWASKSLFEKMRFSKHHIVYDKVLSR